MGGAKYSLLIFTEHCSIVTFLQFHVKNQGYASGLAPGAWAGLVLGQNGLVPAGQLPANAGRPPTRVTMKASVLQGAFTTSDNLERATDFSS